MAGGGGGLVTRLKFTLVQNMLHYRFVSTSIFGLWLNAVNFFKISDSNVLKRDPD